jgi:hypothetical protein
MNLLEAIRDLALLDGECVICAAWPFTETSEAITVPTPESGRVADVEKPGFKYFLEVSVAREFVEGWLSNSVTEPTLQEKCVALIHYAIFDA